MKFKCNVYPFRSNPYLGLTLLRQQTPERGQIKITKQENSFFDEFKVVSVAKLSVDKNKSTTS